MDSKFSLMTGHFLITCMTSVCQVVSPYSFFYLHKGNLNCVVAIKVISMTFRLVFPAVTCKLIILLKSEIESSNKNAMRGRIVLLHY